MRFQIRFTGRELGAVQDANSTGRPSDDVPHTGHTLDVEAPDADAAVRALYKTHNQIRVVDVAELPDKPEGRGRAAAPRRTPWHSHPARKRTHAPSIAPKLARARAMGRDGIPLHGGASNVVAHRWAKAAIDFARAHYGDAAADEMSAALEAAHEEGKKDA